MATIQGIYLALFGRPADPAGLAYFNGVTQNGADLTAIGDLASTDEYQTRFEGQTDAQIINSIYQSLFGRDADPAGLAFFLARLADETYDINNIAIAILDGARDGDLATVNAKIAAADLFTARVDQDIEVDAYDGLQPANIARQYIENVDADDAATPAEADAAIQAILDLGGAGNPNPPGGGGGNPPADPAPIFTSGATGSVDENEGDNAVVYTAVATDNSAVTYSLVNGQDGASFAIDPITGVVTIKDDPDFEDQASYTFTVAATDAAGNVSNQIVTVQVNDVDENDPVFTSDATASVAENAASSEVVYDAAVDDDSAVVFTLDGDDAALFNIDASTGEVTFKASPNFEAPADAGTNNVYDIKVVATDSENNVSTQDVAITVTNVIDTAEELEAALDNPPADGIINLGAGVFTGRFLIDSSVTINGVEGTVINGGFDIENGAVNVAINGVDINTVGAGDANAAILTNTPSGLKNLTLTNVDVEGTGAMGARGLLLNEAFGPSAVNVTITGGSYNDLATGVYAGVDKGHQFTISNTVFTNNGAGIGGVGNGVGLNVTGATFADNIEDDIGVEGGAKLAKLFLSGNDGLEGINVYTQLPPTAFTFNGDVNETNVVLVGAGGSIANAIAGAGNFTVLLGAGDHAESLVLNSKVILAGVEGANLVGNGGISTIVLENGSDGSTIRDLTVVAQDGGNAVYNPNVDVRNITLDGNVFDAGGNVNGVVVYANPGADGWVINDNVFVGETLVGSGFLGLEGAGHLVTNNTFGPLALGNTSHAVESFTPSVIFRGNRDAGGDGFEASQVFFSQYGSIAGENSTYKQNVINVSSLDGKSTAVAGTVAIVDGPFDAREDSLQFVSADNGTGRLRFNEVFSTQDQIKLGDIDVLQFDFLADVASRTDTTPVLRLLIDADGLASTTNDRGELVVEWAYQGNGPVPLDSWQTIDVTGDDLILWQRSNGQNRDTNGNLQTFSEWSDADGFMPAGGLAFNANSTVLGYSFAFGTGNGTGVFYADNLAIGTTGNGGEVDVYNFV